MTKKELNSIRKAKYITHCYIVEGGYYYRPKSSGYTEYVLEAGVFLKEDAISHATKCSDLRLIPVNVFNHNIAIIGQVKSLLERLILIS